jgi:nitrite reductase/ring-hydroxylating ferredoxin subunit
MGCWVKVVDLESMTPGSARKVAVGELRIALFNDGGRLHAVDDACPHQGASLSSGTLHDGRVICPLHSWVFELETGRCPRNSHDPVQVYETRCSAGTLEVRVPSGARDVGESTGESA